jgi:predicted transcriptional regulator of viral defense system
MSDIIGTALAENAILTRGDLARAGIGRRALEAALASGRLVKLRQGIYCDEATSAYGMLDEALACAITGGVIYGASAGRFHGLTDDLPYAINLLVPHGHRTRFLEAGMEMAVKQTRDPRNLEIGIEKVVVDGLHIMVTSKARTVIDLLRLGDVR